MDQHGSRAKAPGGASQCPVDTGAQLWIESSILWCAGEFGKEIVLRDITRPARFLPRLYSATAEQITALVDRVSALMLVHPASIRLDLFDGSAGKKKAAISGSRRMVGHFRMEDGQAVIALDRAESADPAHLTAIIAHELCHVRLLAENRIDTSRPDNERLTDLLTVYFGFGIFSANAAFSYAKAARGWSIQQGGNLDERALNAARSHDGYSRLGYLSEKEFGYALACYCRLRGDAEPAWAPELNTGARGYLDQGLAFIGRTGSGASLPAQGITGTTSKNRSVTIRVAPNAAHIPSLGGFGRPAAGSKQPPGVAGAAERARAAFNRGCALLDAHDVPAARSAFQEAMDLGDLECAAKAAFNLGLLLKKHGSAADAIAAYQVARDSAIPGVAPTASVAQGQLLEQEGDTAGARAAYRQAVDSDDAEQAPRAAGQLGQLLMKKGDVDGARAAYVHASKAPLVSTVACWSPEHGECQSRRWDSDRCWSGPVTSGARSRHTSARSRPGLSGLSRKRPGGSGRYPSHRFNSGAARRAPA